MLHCSVGTAPAPYIGEVTSWHTVQGIFDPCEVSAAPATTAMAANTPHSIAARVINKPSHGGKRHERGSRPLGTSAPPIAAGLLIGICISDEDRSREAGGLHRSPAYSGPEDADKSD